MEKVQVSAVKCYTLEHGLNGPKKKRRQCLFWNTDIMDRVTLNQMLQLKICAGYHQGKFEDVQKKRAWYRLIGNERENVYPKFLLVKSSKKVFIFLPAFYLIIWLINTPIFFEKIYILKL